MDYNKKKADYGVSTVINYLNRIGFKEVKDVTKDKKDEDAYGCDIIALNLQNQRVRIEVKTTTNDKGGIPDCHDSLFNEDRTVKADFFYIVRLDKEDITKIRWMEILTKEEIDRYKDSHKWLRRLRTTKLDIALYKGLVGKKIPTSELSLS